MWGIEGPLEKRHDTDAWPVQVSCVTTTIFKWRFTAVDSSGRKHLGFRVEAVKRLPRHTSRVLAVATYHMYICMYIVYVCTCIMYCFVCVLIVSQGSSGERLRTSLDYWKAYIWLLWSVEFLLRNREYSSLCSWVHERSRARRV